MGPNHNIELGKEQRLGVVLVISSGYQPVYDVSDLKPGIREGLYDMAQDGLNGKMILYGLGFQFRRQYYLSNSRHH